MASRQPFGEFFPKLECDGNRFCGGMQVLRRMRADLRVFQRTLAL
jgi:hypothetical protein